MESKAVGVASLQRANPWSPSASSHLPEPLDELRNAFVDLHLRIVAQLRPSLVDVGEGDWHIAWLRRLAVDDRVPAKRLFQQLDETRERHRLRFAQVENLVAKFLLRAGDDAIDSVSHVSIIARGAAVAEDGDGFPL